MTTTTKQKPSAEEGRARLIKLIHVARRDLERAGRMDEPGYRELLRAASNGRHDSAADMSYTELKAALVRLQQAGFQARKAPSKRPMAMAPEDRKARALWLFLHVLGVVKDPSEQALAAYVRRIAKVDDLRWARGVRADLPKYPGRSELIIESLKKWAMRFLPAIVGQLKAEVIKAGQAGQLSPEQVQHALDAQSILNHGEGFDVYWWAWESLMLALNRPILADLSALRTKGAQK
ncbi:MAG TPA: regulatory protein GemA [Alicycliphilus sp.]|nr:regulatory protein GemA [Alicycliphilus sp.]